MPTTRFCLVRHGETDWNAIARMQGHTDIPLNATGHEQAAMLARALALKNHRFDALYVSDLTRARQTATPIAQALGLDIQLTPPLRERHMGIFQGISYTEAEQRHPEAYRQYQARDPEFDLLGGESLNAFHARIRACLDELSARHAGQTLLLVSHGGALDMMRRIATGKPLTEPRDFRLPNAALNWISQRAGLWALESWGDESHLAAALDEIQ